MHWRPRVRRHSDIFLVAAAINMSSRVSIYQLTEHMHSITYLQMYIIFIHGCMYKKLKYTVGYEE